MSTEAGEEDQIVKAVKAVQELYNIQNTYFPKNPSERIDKLRSQLAIALEFIDSIPLEQRIDPALRAMHEYVRGEMLNIIPDYCKEAEDHLSEAVNLNPSLVDAWLSLGKCMLKKGDVTAAKNCFTLALKEGPNKEILCQLSMITRKMARGAENQAELIEESILHARKAITLDVKYGNSWHNLGSAYLASFFATGAVDRNKLTQSFKAYQNAVKDEGLKSNPGLRFNFAVTHRYMENFEMALTEFEAAAALWDRGHKVSASIQNVIDQVDKLDNVLKGYARVKKSASLTIDPPSLNLNTSYRMVTTDTLSEGLNKGVAVLGKTLSFIKHEITPPMHYVICDSDKECFALSLLRMQYDMIKIGDQLILIEPFHYQYDFSWKGKEYKFKLVRLNYLNQLIVNGKSLFQEQAVVPASTHAQDKP